MEGQVKALTSFLQIPTHYIVYEYGEMHRVPITLTYCRGERSVSIAKKSVIQPSTRLVDYVAFVRSATNSVHEQELSAFDMTVKVLNVHMMCASLCSSS